MRDHYGPFVSGPVRIMRIVAYIFVHKGGYGAYLHQPSSMCRTSHVTMVPYQNMAEKPVFLTVYFENNDFVRCLHFQGPTCHISD